MVAFAHLGFHSFGWNWSWPHCEVTWMMLSKEIIPKWPCFNYSDFSHTIYYNSWQILWGHCYLISAWASINFLPYKSTVRPKTGHDEGISVYLGIEIWALTVEVCWWVRVTTFKPKRPQTLVILHMEQSIPFLAHDCDSYRFKMGDALDGFVWK